MHLEDLPIEILVKVISLLPLDSLLTLSEVSKYFYDLVNSELQSGKIPIDLEINEDFYRKNPKVSMAHGENFGILISLRFYVK